MYWVDMVALSAVQWHACSRAASMAARAFPSSRDSAFECPPVPVPAARSQAPAVAVCSYMYCECSRTSVVFFSAASCTFGVGAELGRRGVVAHSDGTPQRMLISNCICSCCWVPCARRGASAMPVQNFYADCCRLPMCSPPAINAERPVMCFIPRVAVLPTCALPRTVAISAWLRVCMRCAARACCAADCHRCPSRVLRHGCTPARFASMFLSTAFKSARGIADAHHARRTARSVHARHSEHLHVHRVQCVFHTPNAFALVSRCFCPFWRACIKRMCTGYVFTPGGIVLGVLLCYLWASIRKCSCSRRH